MSRSKKGKTIYLSGKKRRRRKNYLGQIKLLIGLAVIIGAIIGGIIAFLPNAYQVKINNEEIGIVKQKDIVEKAKQLVVMQLEERYSSKVKLEKEPEITKIRAKKKQIVTPEYLTSRMREKMDFKIEFREMTVDGKVVGIVENDDIVKELQKRLAEKYLGQAYKEQPVTFKNKVDLKPIFAKENEVMSLETLVEKCSVTSEQDIEYEIVSGDTLWGISAKLGLTLQDLEDENPGLTETSKLKIGGKLKAKVDVPLLGIEAPKKAK